MFEHGLLASFLPGLELQLAAQHVDHGAQVDHPGHRVGLAQHRAAMPCGGGNRLGRRDRKPRRHPGALIDRIGLPQGAGKPGHHLDQMVGHLGVQVRLLEDHPHLGVEFQRVVRPDLGAEPVFERGDDATPVGVVLGVGAGDHQDVQRQPQGVAAHLNVALLHHVEHRHLDALGQIGQFVDRDDAAVRPRDQTVRNGLGVSQGAPLGDLDRVDVAHQVGDAGVGGGQLLRVALTAVLPLHRQIIAERGGPPDRLRGDRRVGMLAEFGAPDHRGPLVEQADQCPQQPGLALTALTEEHEVVARDQRPLQLRQHGVVEAQDSRPDLVTFGQPGQQVFPDFLFDSPFTVPGGTQFADGAGQVDRCGHHSTLRR